MHCNAESGHENFGFNLRNQGQGGFGSFFLHAVRGDGQYESSDLR